MFMADGPNVRSRMAESVKEEMATQGRKPADPLVAEQLPKSRREQYFNGLRNGRLWITDVNAPDILPRAGRLYVSQFARALG